ncbi:hypothetical protein ABFS83_13G133600 [Erythranthe nasuta]
MDGGEEGVNSKSFVVRLGAVHLFKTDIIKKENTNSPSSSSSGSKPYPAFSIQKENAPGAADAGTTSRLDTDAPSSSSSGSKPCGAIPTLKNLAVAAVAATFRLDTSAPSSSSSGSKPYNVIPTLKENATPAVSAVTTTSRLDTNAPSSSSSGSKPYSVIPTLERDAATSAAVDAEPENIKNQRRWSQETVSGNSSPHWGSENIWSDPRFTTGQAPIPIVAPPTVSTANKPPKPRHFKTRNNKPRPSKSDVLNLFNLDYPLCDVQFPGFDNGVNTAYDYYDYSIGPADYPTATSNYSMCNHQYPNEAIPEPGFQIDVQTFVYILTQGSMKQKAIVVSILRGSIIALMIDDRAHMQHLFHTLIESCEGQLLDEVAVDVLSDQEGFVNAAVSILGVDSIMKLMVKLRKTYHAFNLTKVLSNKFLHVMTHSYGAMVVEKCLMLFGYEANKIIYEKAIIHYKQLATHKTGCRALNHCIKYIEGEQRLKLLNLVADISDFLSFDPYGNYVVQRVLEQANEEVNKKILRLLEKHFLELAHLKGGSHVVEKCMKTSDDGLLSVVKAILERPETAFVLARDDFGNYVIQNALRITRARGFSGSYNNLVRCLLPYCRELNQSKPGKCVIGILNEGRLYQRAESGRTNSIL